MRVPEIQRKIAVLLLNEPKTAEDINKQLNVDYVTTTKELNNMMKQSLIKKLPGFPTKYTLDNYILEKIKKRKEIAENDSYKLKIRAIIELQGIDKDLIKFNLEKMKSLIDDENNFTIYETKISEVIEQDNMYYGFLDITLTLKNFSTLIYFITYYIPVSVEVISPTKYDISIFELQDGLMDLSTIMQKYSAEFQKRLTKEEIEKMHKKLFNAKK